MSTEIITQIKGFEGLYEISNLGYVISMRKKTKLEPLKKDKRLYVRLYKIPVIEDGEKIYSCETKFIDELLASHFDTNQKKCNINTLSIPYKKQYERPKFVEKFDFVLYYEDDIVHAWNDKTDEITTVNKVNDIINKETKQKINKFYVLDCFQRRDKKNKPQKFTDDDLLNFKNVFLQNIKELRTNNIFKIYYTRYWSHYSASNMTFQNLVNKSKYDFMESIDLEEHDLFNKCHNGGNTYFDEKQTKKTIQSYGYDYKANYPTLLSSKKFKIPITKPRKEILLELPTRKEIILGIYRVKITCKNKEFLKVFNYSPDDHYTDTSLKFAMKYQERFNVKIALILDNQTNAYIYDKWVTGDTVFGQWYETLYKLKTEFPKNKLVKALFTMVWGVITHPKIKNVPFEELKNYKIGEEYKVISRTVKGKNDCNEYYEIAPKKNMYYFNIRIKPFLTAFARENIAKVVLSDDNIDYLIRTHTDNATFTKPINYKKFDLFEPEEKTSGLIKWKSGCTYYHVEQV